MRVSALRVTITLRRPGCTVVTKNLSLSDFLDMTCGDSRPSRMSGPPNFELAAEPPTRNRLPHSPALPVA